MGVLDMFTTGIIQYFWISFGSSLPLIGARPSTTVTGSGPLFTVFGDLIEAD